MNFGERLKAHKREKKAERLLAESVAEAASAGGAQLMEARKPKDCAMALELLAQGKGYDEIEAQTGLGWNALKSLRSRHDVALDVRRQQLARDGWEMADGIRLLQLKKLQKLADDPEALDKVSIRDLALARNMELEHSMSVLGEQTTTVKHVSGKPSLADAMAAIKEAREALQKEAIPVEVAVNVTPGATGNIQEAK